MPAPQNAHNQLVRSVCLGLLVVVLPLTAAAQTDSTAQRSGSWTLLPILFSSPDTGFGFGVLPQYVFRTSPAARPSNVRMDLYYTQEGQFNVTLRTAAWLADNSLQVAGKAQAREWPTTYYGIGNTFADSLREAYTERSVDLSAQAQRRLRPGIFAGVGLRLRLSTLLERESGRALASGAVAGGDGGQALGAQVFLTFDTRDEVFYPTQGHLVQLESSAYAPVVGTDFGFTHHRLDARRYLQLHGPHVLALQGVFGVSTGTTPFQLLPGVGRIVRGYTSMRYADRHVLAAQVEYRVAPLWWRLGLAVFVGAGQVAPRVEDFALDRFHVAIGAGLRFQIIRSENINVRWDFGFGAGSSGDYLDLNEAF